MESRVLYRSYGSYDHNINLGSILLFSIFMMFSISFNVGAHDISNVDEFSVTQTNDKITRKADQLREVFVNYYEQRIIINKWPPSEFSRYLNELMHLKGDSDLNIDYFIDMGINVYAMNDINKNPIVEQSIAANNVIFAGIALLEIALRQSSQKEFVEILHSEEKAAYMYNTLLKYNYKVSSDIKGSELTKNVSLSKPFAIMILFTCIIMVFIYFSIRSNTYNGRD